MLLSNDSHRFLTPARLEELSKLRSEHGPVFSLYLDLRPEQKSRPARFERLLAQAAEQAHLDQAPEDYRSRWNQDEERLRGWLERDTVTAGQSAAQGLAIFASQPDGLWQIILLPAPALDRLEVKDQPYTRPLEILLGEFQCTLVALINAGGARLVKVHFGQAEEIANVEAVPVTGGEVEIINPHARAVAVMVQDAWAEQGCGQLIIGGDDDLLYELRDALPITLQERLVGEITLAPQANLDAVLNEALEIEQAYERQIEAQRVDALISGAAGGMAVLGLEQTLRAAAGDRKVRLLVVEEDFREEGGECPNCGFLTDDEQSACLMCGFAVRREPDIIEAALKRVLDEGGEIEVLRSGTSRNALGDHGRIGALLHDPAAQPPRVKETANQQAITTDGEINPEIARDEKVEESFPASDPPGAGR